jgi:hypothetical protein
MKIISHRGNIRGPQPDRENKPSYIDAAIGCNFDVEIDLRFDGTKLWLGHDKKEVEVNEKWLLSRKNYLWIHCKDMESVTILKKIDKNFTYFCHHSDPYTLISNGKIWVHKISKNLTDDMVIPLMSQQDLEQNFNQNVFAVCTDFPILIKI